MSRLAERFRKGRRYLQRWMSPRRLGPVLLLKIFGANVSISISEVHISYLHILLYGNVLDHLIFKTVSVHRLVNLHHFHITTQSVIEGANLLILSPQVLNSSFMHIWLTASNLYTDSLASPFELLIHLKRAANCGRLICSSSGMN